MMVEAFKDASEIMGHALSVAMKNTSGRIKVFMVLIFILMLVLVAFNLPYLITIAIGQNNDVGGMNIFEFMLSSILADKGRAVFSYYILSVIVFTLFTPIASNSLLSVYNKSSMVSLRKNDSHKVAETIILQLLSVTNLILFFTTIAVSSLFSYVYGYDVRIFILCFLMWLVGLALTSFNGWMVEFSLRKYGVWAKAALITVWIITISLFFLTFFNTNMLIYEVTDLFFHAFTSLEATLLIGLGLLVVIFIITFVTFKIGIHTINQTAPYVSDKVKKVDNFKYDNQLGLMFKILWRNGNVRSPILLMSIVTFVSLTFFINDKSGMVGFIVAAPMVVTMSVAINFFGVVGSGNAWMFSVQGYTSKIIPALFRYNVVTAILINTIAIIPSVILGRINYMDGVSFIVVSLICSLIISVVALHFSVFKPNKYDVHIRGENILPPSKSLTALLTVVLSGGIPAGLIFIYAPLLMQTIILIPVAFLTIMLSFYYKDKLSAAYNVNDIISQTS